jgi:[ribosomal protein S18]-alanine N-acetyltransferase
MVADRNPKHGRARVSPLPCPAMDDLAVAPARPDDLDALVRLEERTFTEDRISRRAWRHLLSRAHGQVLVVRRVAPEGEPPTLLAAAVVLYRRRSATARLYSLAVSPDARGAGLGRRLLDEVGLRAAAAGCRRLRLEVRDDNAAAMALYRGAGFREVARLPDYYSGGASGLRMERSL